MKAVYVEQTGGPENLIYGDRPQPNPGPGEALVKIAAAGVNFIDVYFRTGLYPADPPVMLGSEAAGTVEAIGPDVTEVQAGDRGVGARSLSSPDSPLGRRPADRPARRSGDDEAGPGRTASRGSFGPLGRSAMVRTDGPRGAGSPRTFLEAASATS